MVGPGLDGVAVFVHMKIDGVIAISMDMEELAMLIPGTEKQRQQVRGHSWIPV